VLPESLRGKEREREEAGYTEEQILFALKQAEAGQVVTDVCQQMGISEATFYVWKKKNARLKRLVADLTLDRLILQEVVKEKI
jgi:putative transposase